MLALNLGSGSAADVAECVGIHKTPTTSDGRTAVNKEEAVLEADAQPDVNLSNVVKDPRKFFNANFGLRLLYAWGGVGSGNYGNYLYEGRYFIYRKFFENVTDLCANTKAYDPPAMHIAAAQQKVTGFRVICPTIMQDRVIGETPVKTTAVMMPAQSETSSNEALQNIMQDAIKYPNIKTVPSTQMPSKAEAIKVTRGAKNHVVLRSVPVNSIDATTTKEKSKKTPPWRANKLS